MEGVSGMAYCSMHNKVFSDVANCPWCEEAWEEEQDLEQDLDDGTDDDCMDCGTCDSCIARTQAYFEEMERGVQQKQSRCGSGERREP